jgi:hypothetical protein
LIPIVIQTTPNNGSTNVPVTSNITIEWSTPLLTSSVVPANFILENLNAQTPISCLISLDNTPGNNDGRIVTITPDDDAGWNNAGLNGLTLYLLTISNILSADNSKYPGVYTLEFTTAADEADEVPIFEEDPNIGDSYELHGREIDTLQLPTPTFSTLYQRNQEMINFLLEERGLTLINWTAPSFIAQEYVDKKTEYDLIYHKYKEMAISAQSHKLADLSVSFRSSLQDLENLLKKLKGEYEYWEEKLLGVTNKTKPRSFVKGSLVDENPDFLNRKFVDLEGTKSW